MRLTVLGGAAAWPNPGQGCSSYLLTVGGRSVIVDCGPGTLPELRKHVDYHSIDAVVISHCHADHLLDLVPYRYGLLYGPTPLRQRINVWLPPGGTEVLRRVAGALNGGEDVDSFWQRAFDIREYDPESRLELTRLTVTFAPTQHFVPCFAMRLTSAEERTLFYSADTGRVDNLVGLAMGCDVALVEGTIDQHPEGHPDLRGHITPQEAGVLANRAAAKRLIMTHLWNERPDDVVIAAACSTFDGPVAIAKPGMVVDV
jgi:ribonuclease BN (tRNA processing enzyme)